MTERDDWRWCGACQDRVDPDDAADCTSENCPMRAPVDTGDELHQVLGAALLLQHLGGEK